MAPLRKHARRISSSHRENIALSGNIVFAAGTENFASADQIGGFASQTYGGGMRFRFASGKTSPAVFSLQRRTQTEPIPILD